MFVVDISVAISGGGGGCIKNLKKSGSRNQCSARRSKMTWSEARRSVQRSSDERGFCTPNLQFCHHEKADDNGKANPPPLAHVLEQFSACAYHYDPTEQPDNILTSKMTRGPSNCDQVIHRSPSPEGVYSTVCMHD